MPAESADGDFMFRSGASGNSGRKEGVDMSQDQFKQLMGGVMEGMALYLLELATDDVGPKEFQTCRSGDLVHLRVKNSKGEVCLQLAGKDTSELGVQFVLTSLHNISIEQLGALHKRPLKRALQVQIGKQ